MAEFMIKNCRELVRGTVLNYNVKKWSQGFFFLELWRSYQLLTFGFYCQVKKLYSWHDVARRTEIVYNRALKCSNPPLLDRLSRYATSLKEKMVCQGISLP